MYIQSKTNVREWREVRNRELKKVRKGTSRISMHVYELKTRLMIEGKCHRGEETPSLKRQKISYINNMPQANSLRESRN